jgi:hypothetical protein
MSYDVCFKDPASGSPVSLDQPHDFKGGTYALGGTLTAELNITYNYGTFYYQTLGDNGIRSLYGLTAQEVIPLLAEAVAVLGAKRHSNYWEPTPGNAGAALLDLIGIAALCPPGAVFDGD